MAYLDRSELTGRFGFEEWREARIAALAALGDAAEAQKLRWRMFRETLGPDYLRDNLKDLPDFEDVEEEDRALALAEAHEHVHGALALLVNWPAHERAARLVMIRHEELDGNIFYVLAQAVDALEGRYPQAAVLLRRALIEDSLNGAKSRRYKHADRHLLEIERLDLQIDDYGAHETHAVFAARLRDKHGRNRGFWGLVSAS